MYIYIYDILHTLYYTPYALYYNNRVLTDNIHVEQVFTDGKPISNNSKKSILMIDKSACH